MSSVPIRQAGFKHGVRHPVTGETIKKFPVPGPAVYAAAGITEAFGFALYLTSEHAYHPTDLTKVKPAKDDDTEAVPRRTVVPISDVAWMDVPLRVVAATKLDPGDQEHIEDAEAEAAARQAIEAERAKLLGGGG